MMYRGKIKNGVVIFDQLVSLPDGTAVRIEVEDGNTDSLHERTVEELARAQNISPVCDPPTLRIDWPDDDSIDEFLLLVRAVR